MPQRIVPSKVLTVTKDGECHVMITLDLNININTNTNGQAHVSSNHEDHEVDHIASKEDDTEWQIPDFSTFNSNLLNFGKDVDNPN